MDFIVIAMPEWLWISAFAGCFAFGGLCAGLAVYALGVRPLVKQRDFVSRDTLPDLWEPEHEP